MPLINKLSSRLLLCGASLSLCLMLPSMAHTSEALEALITAADLWALDTEAFARKVAALSFYWLSEDKSAARSQAPGLTLREAPVVEVQARFADNTLAELVLSFYNRGDVGQIDRAEFERQYETCSNVIARLAAVEGRSWLRPPAGARQSLRVAPRIVVWTAAQSVYRLEAAASEIKDATGKATLRPEYITLSIKPPAGVSRVAPVGMPSGRAGLVALRQRVKRMPNGDVLLEDIPMVDQGQKGYCAAATAERVMRYYGLDFDQHAIAQHANTSAQGTDSQAFDEALSAIARAVSLRLCTLEKLKISGILRQVKSYNREAQRRRAPEILLPTAGVLNMNDIYSQMDKEIFLRSRAGAGEETRFMRNVQDKINSGYPLFWGVTLGFVDEEVLPQGSRGHMRLIIGYNAKTGTIFYSDSWGAGHEKKRMSQAEACAITTGLFSMEPG